MVTGKSDQRLSMARNAVKNFVAQTHPNKHLIIVNHGTENVMGNLRAGSAPKNITEVLVLKINGKTLGDLRNVSISYVPINAIWTTWDDDDVRDPNYLVTLHRHMLSTGTNAVLIKNRYEYNRNTGRGWSSSMTDGFYWYFMRNDPRFKYASLDTGEDKFIKQNLHRIPGFVSVLDNDPIMYVRVIHKDNTSMFVRKNQKDARNVSGRYSERELSEKEDALVRNKASLA
jgi:hypothetical protein